MGLSLRKGHIVWLNGPYECGMWNDLSIFRDSLISFLGEGERVEADDGYVGAEPDYCKTPGGACSKSEGVEACKQRKLFRARHESVNARLKNFEVLNQKYRHSLYSHGDVFRAVAVLVQLSIENGEPLWQVITE